MEQNTANTKKSIRRTVLEQRKNLSADYVAAASKAICDRIRSTEYYKECDRLCLYMPVNNEVDVTFLLDIALSEGREIYLPRVEGTNMDFFYYDKNIPLVTGKYNILEPQSHKALIPDGNTLVIMPGAVFSGKCDRIGYGGGYYDRYLSRQRAVKTIAAAYQFQIYPDIPVEETDIRPDYIIGEEKIYGNPDRHGKKG